MLQTIGKHIQGWIAGVVIAVIALAFILFGLEYYLTRGNGQQTTVASVDGVAITHSQLENAYNALQRGYTQQGVALNEQMQQQLQGMALQQLILDQVLLQSAQRLKLAVSSQIIQQEIANIPIFQEQGQFSPQLFQQLLSRNGVSPEVFIQRMQSSLLINQLSTGIKASAFALPDELARAHGLLYQQRDFGYFVLPSAPFVAAIRPTEDQINAYYQQHANQFRLPEQVKAAYLVLTPDAIQSSITVTPEEIQDYYQSHSSEFQGKSINDVKANIEQRLRQQRLNEALAAKSEQLQNLTYTNPTSLDTAAKALDLPVKTTDWMSREGVSGDPLFSNPQVLQAVFSDEVLKKNNNSLPIELKTGGFIVVRVAEHRESQSQPLAAVHEQISKQLQKDQGEKQAGLRAYDIQRDLESGATSEALAKKYHLVWVTKTKVTRQSQDKTTSPQLVEAVFGLAPAADPAKKSVISVLLADGNYAIARLDSLHTAELDQTSVKDQEETRAALAERWGELDFHLFVKSARDKAKIKNHLESSGSS